MTTLLLLLFAPFAEASEPLRVTGGYHGDFLSHPGGYVGLSAQTAEAGAYSFHLGADLGAYHHERNHTGAFLRGNLATRIGTPSGFFVEPRFVLGYLHTWVDGDEYWVVDSVTGQNRLATNAGDPNITYGLGVGLGWELEQGLAFVVRPEAVGRAPYNGYTLAQFGLQVGVEWALGGAK